MYEFAYRVAYCEGMDIANPSTPTDPGQHLKLIVPAGLARLVLPGVQGTELTRRPQTAPSTSPPYTNLPHETLLAGAGRPQAATQ